MAHDHAHEHDHDHGHDHHHDGGDYYLQQLLTVFICGAFGVAGILMCILSAGTLKDDAGNPITKIAVLLAPEFRGWVLAGAVLLLIVTAIRGMALWRTAGAKAHDHDHHHGHDHKPGEPCDHPAHAHEDHTGHDHKPGEACNHPAHAHAGHDHGDHSADDHAHGNIYWRVVVLLLPIVILVMGLPNGTFSTEYLLAGVRGSEVSDLGDVTDRGSTDVGFEALALAAYSKSNREAFTGQTATVSGKIKRINEKQFTLFFYKQTCCAADQVPLKATCVVADRGDLDKTPDGKDVVVTGQIQFAEVGKDDWITVLKVGSGGLKMKR